MLKQLEEKLVGEFKQRMTQDKEVFEEHKISLEQRAASNRLFSWSQRLTLSPFFQAFLLLSLMGNIALQLCEGYPVNLFVVETTENLNAAYLIIILFELGVKSLAFGPKLYWKSSRENRYDILITGITCFDVIFTRLYLTSVDQLEYGVVMTIIKGTRIIRFFKLARFWTRFQILLDTLKLTAVRTISFGCLVIFVMLSYTLVG